MDYYSPFKIKIPNCISKLCAILAIFRKKEVKEALNITILLFPFIPCFTVWVISFIKTCWGATNAKDHLGWLWTHYFICCIWTPMQPMYVIETANISPVKQVISFIQSPVPPGNPHVNNFSHEVASISIILYLKNTYKNPSILLH